MPWDGWSLSSFLPPLLRFLQGKTFNPENVEIVPYNILSAKIPTEKIHLDTGKQEITAANSFGTVYETLRHLNWCKRYEGGKDGEFDWRVYQIDDQTAQQWLNKEMRPLGKHEVPRLGDVLSIWRVGEKSSSVGKEISEGSNNIARFLHTYKPVSLRLEHMALYIDSSLLFEKIGGAGDKPFRITNSREIETTYPGVFEEVFSYSAEATKERWIHTVHRECNKKKDSDKIYSGYDTMDGNGSFSGFGPSFTSRFSMSATKPIEDLEVLWDIFPKSKLSELGITLHGTGDMEEEEKVDENYYLSDSDKRQQLREGTTGEKGKKMVSKRQRNIGLQKSKRYSLFVADVENASGSPIVAATEEMHDPEDYSFGGSIINQLGSRPIYG